MCRAPSPPRSRISRGTSRFRRFFRRRGSRLLKRTPASSRSTATRTSREGSERAAHHAARRGQLRKRVVARRHDRVAPLEGLLEGRPDDGDVGRRRQQARTRRVLQPALSAAASSPTPRRTRSSSPSRVADAGPDELHQGSRRSHAAGCAPREDHLGQPHVDRAARRQLRPREPGRRSSTRSRHTSIRRVPPTTLESQWSSAVRPCRHREREPRVRIGSGAQPPVLDSDRQVQPNDVPRRAPRRTTSPTSRPSRAS